MQAKEVLQFAGGRVAETIEEITSLLEGEKVDEFEGIAEVKNLRHIQAGAGEHSFNYNDDGFYLGAMQIADAKFGYRYSDKTLFITDGVFTLYNAGVKSVEIKDNSIHIYNDGEIVIGDERLKMEVENGHGRIIINDGTNDRILLGYKAGLF